MFGISFVQADCKKDANNSCLKSLKDISFTLQVLRLKTNNQIYDLTVMKFA